MGKFDRNSPALATIQDRYPLTKESSTKETWHITLDMTNIDVLYEPGDSIGIYAQNDPLLVEHLIDAMQAAPSSTITHKRTGETHTLKEFLTCHANLSRITSSFLKLINECTDCNQSKEDLTTLLEDKVKLRAYLAEKDPLNLLREYHNTRLPLQQMANQFGPLLPRFYSIASSKKTSPNKLDLTVALFTWMQGGEKLYGVASHFLCHLANPHTTPIPFFVQPAAHFRLPENPEIDLIMVGPGTGIAPFRAFMQERKKSKASHHLFFGERSRKSDYFYEKEWEGYSNLKVRTAFSRDQEEKIYVQHKMLQEGKDLFHSIEQGAHLYVCGDARVMSKDVDHALHQIVEKHGRMSQDEAKSYIKALKKEGRYLLDVY